MNNRIVRLIAGLVAGGVTVVLVDQFLLPGTLLPGLVSVVSAVTVLSLATHDA